MVALFELQDACTQRVLLPGKTQDLRFAAVPSQRPAHVPLPAQAVRATVVGEQVPFAFDVLQASHWPVQSESQHRPSAQCPLEHSPAPPQVIPFDLATQVPLSQTGVLPVQGVQQLDCAMQVPLLHIFIVPPQLGAAPPEPVTPPEPVMPPEPADMPPLPILTPPEPRPPLPPAVPPVRAPPLPAATPPLPAARPPVPGEDPPLPEDPLLPPLPEVLASGVTVGEPPLPEEPPEAAPPEPVRAPPLPFGEPPLPRAPPLLLDEPSPLSEEPSPALEEPSPPPGEPSPLALSTAPSLTLSTAPSARSSLWLSSRGLLQPAISEDDTKTSNDSGKVARRKGDAPLDALASSPTSEVLEVLMTVLPPRESPWPRVSASA